MNGDKTASAGFIYFKTRCPHRVPSASNANRIRDFFASRVEEPAESGSPLIKPDVRISRAGVFANWLACRRQDGNERRERQKKRSGKM